MLAARLDYAYLETGAMYRSLALRALETGTDLNDAAALGKLAAAADMQCERVPSGVRFLLHGRDVTQAIRSPEVTKASSVVSVHPEVRTRMVERQRVFGQQGGVVMEGRDIGTQVFPDADLKIFLDASPEVRAERRLRDLEGAAPPSAAEVMREMTERDQRDQMREQSPLVPAEDAIRIDSTPISAEQVVEQVLRLAEEKLAATN